MNFPKHELAQYKRADQLGHDTNGFYLMSSDDSGEQESFESIFGAELPFVKSDYPSLFIFQTEDMTVVYGCTRVCVMVDSPVDLIYFWSIDTIKDGAYSPYAGMSLESGQVWGHETFTPYESNIRYAGLMPLLERTRSEEKYLVAKTIEKTPRLVLIYNRKAITTAFLLTRIEAIRLHNSIPTEPLYEMIIKIIDKWGVK